MSVWEDSSTTPSFFSSQAISKKYARGRKPQYGTKYVAAAKDDHELAVEDDQEFLPLHAVGGSTTPPYKVPLVINDVVHTMELDTGASVTLMSVVNCFLRPPSGSLLCS